MSYFDCRILIEFNGAVDEFVNVSSNLSDDSGEAEEDLVCRYHPTT